ncbi:MAG: peptidylprolyl isomerase [Aquabacterium sp.]|nr:peptidylprolyl isomerase [Ferruginibacter sp.]
MHKKIFSFIVLLSLIFAANCTQAQTKKKAVKKAPIHATKSKLVKKAVVVSAVDTTAETRVKITTSLGNIVVKLSNKTPKHRDNFIKLVTGHFYDSTLFHRVINSFMIQGGDPTSKNAAPGIMLGEGGAGYTIPAEFDSTLFHKKGALAAARDDNPEKASSGCQFYIVEGKKINDGELDMTEMKNGIKFSPAKRMTYKMNGGTPFLDTRYTVFGEVESGIEVVEKIALEPVDSNNRPLTDISMKMEVLKEEIK